MANVRSIAYWAVFAAVQAAGFISVSLTNIHSNIAPLFLGVALLLPGGVLLFLLELPSPLLVGILVAVNFATWAVFKKWGYVEWWPAK